MFVFDFVDDVEQALVVVMGLVLTLFEGVQVRRGQSVQALTLIKANRGFLVQRIDQIIITIMQLLLYTLTVTRL